MDRLVMRLEPLIDSRFSEISSISVPKYNKQLLLQQIVSIRKHLKFNQKLLTETDDELDDQADQHSNATDLADENGVESNLQRSRFDFQGLFDFVFTDGFCCVFSLVLHRWWGKNRLDYELYCPRGISNFPNNTLPVLFHSSFWESSDVASFVMDKVNTPELI